MHGIDEGFHELAVQANEFQGNHQDDALMPGTGDVVQVPKSRSLRELLESDGMSSLAERALGWRATAPAPSAGGDKRKAAQFSGAAKAKAKKSKNTSGVGCFPPPWVCRAAWYGDTCRLNGCQYDHVNGITYTAGLAAPAAAPGQSRQQQQIHQPQEQPQQQPQQQQQPQAAAGGGVQQPSVANFSRMVGGGRGGGGGCGGANAGRGGAGRCAF